MDFLKDFTESDIQLFLVEAEELLQVTEECLVALEQEPGDEALIEEIFRAIHTLKGSSATLGHKQMADLAHSMENILDRVRNRDINLDTPTATKLLRGLDTLSSLKDEVATGQSLGVDISPLLLELDDACGDDGAPGGSPPQGEAPPATARDAILTGLQQGQQAWRVELTVTRESVMPEVRLIQAYLLLSEKGKIVFASPPLEEIESTPGLSDLELWLLTLEDEESAHSELEVAVPETDAVIYSYSLENAFELLTAFGDAESDVMGQEKPEPEKKLQAEVQPQKAVAKQRSRAANQTVRVNIDVLDNLMNLVGELVIDRARITDILQSATTQGGSAPLIREIGAVNGHIGRITTELQEEIMKSRMLPVDTLFKKFPRMVRDLSLQAGKEIDLIIEGRETELDRAVIEEISDPLMHLLRNAVDHGIEDPDTRRQAGKPPQGIVRLSATHRENHIVITVSDDGAGINTEKVLSKAVDNRVISAEAAGKLSHQEALSLIFESGFSTANGVSKVSGRGVGMDVVRTNIQKLSGSIEIESTSGQGSVFRVKLPLTLAIIRALIVRIANEYYALHLSSVSEGLELDPGLIRSLKRRRTFVSRGKVVPLFDLGRLLNVADSDRHRQDQTIPIVVVQTGGRRYGLEVDEFIGEQEIVIKSIGNYLGNIPGLAGATILGQGNVALILDVTGLLRPSVIIEAGLEASQREPLQAGLQQGE